MEQTLYVSQNLSRTEETKFGVFFNKRYERILDSSEQFSNISKYVYLYDLKPTNSYKLNIKTLDDIISYIARDLHLLEAVEELYQIKLPTLRKISLYLLNNDGGIELIKSSEKELIDLFVITELESLGINVRKYTEEEVNKINENIKREYNNKSKIYSIDNIFKPNKIYSDREYQNTIINNSLVMLDFYGKIYLELATGAGKTFITFKIISELKPDIIICFSPRTKINKQNLSKKYLEMIGSEYKPFNFTTEKIIIDDIKDNKIIITSCIQSYTKLYQLISKLDIKNKNIFVWFDEAHWGIEESWLINNKKEIKFWLKNKNINYRFFTSASPDHHIIKSNNNIFGELYQPIKIKELIKQQWLCNINPYIFETKKENKIDLIDYILDTFSKLNKNWGLSFHNKDKYAFKMFVLHLNKFVNKETTIKPFLIIGDKQYYKKLKYIKFNYDYSSLENYENEEKSIAYVVKKVDMGYDFSKLDFIVFSDPKISYKDIIQCIGRGCRPDFLGENGKNKFKKLLVLLPVFINTLEDNNDYKDIINVLRYLIEDIGLDIQKCIINKNKEKSNSLGGNVKELEYNGDENVAAKLLDLLGFKINIKNLTELLIKNNITNEEEYVKFVNNNKHIKLKKNIYNYEGFKWKPIIDPNSSIYYKTYSECNNAVKNIISNLDNQYSEKIINEILISFEDNGWIEYNKYDNKIPPFNRLNEYYY